MRTDQLKLYGAGITDDEDGAIDLEYDADGKPIWKLIRNMDANGVTIARILGGEVPNPLNIGEPYFVPITVPHGQPLVGFAYVKKRLGERDNFVEPKLFYRTLNGNPGEVVVAIQGEGLFVQCGSAAFDNDLGERVATAISEEVGECTTASRGDYILVTFEEPLDHDHDVLLDTCHRVAEIVYATLH